MKKVEKYKLPISGMKEKTSPEISGTKGIMKNIMNNSIPIKAMT